MKTVAAVWIDLDLLLRNLKGQDQMLRPGRASSMFKTIHYLGVLYG